MLKYIKRKLLLLALAAFSSFSIPLKTAKASFFEENKTLVAAVLGAVIASTIGFVWWVNASETADDIPVYLADLTGNCISVEGHEYIRAWLQGTEWQQWFCNLVATKQNASEMYRVISELKELERKLEIWKLSRISHLTKKFNIKIEEAHQCKERVIRLSNALLEMEKRAREIYNKQAEYEAVIKKYQSFRHRIEHIKEREIFKIDINNIKSYAMVAFPTSAWPYVEVMRFLESNQHDVHLLLQEIIASPLYFEKDGLLLEAEELYRRMNWAIEYLKNSPDYQQQVQMKRQYDIARQRGSAR